MVAGTARLKPRPFEQSVLKDAPRLSRPGKLVDGHLDDALGVWLCASHRGHTGAHLGHKLSVADVAEIDLDIGQCAFDACAR